MKVIWSLFGRSNQALK